MPAEPLELELQHVRRMNLAAQQNGVPLVSLLWLSNRSSELLGDLELRLEVEPALGKFCSYRGGFGVR